MIKLYDHSSPSSVEKGVIPLSPPSLTSGHNRPVPSLMLSLALPNPLLSWLQLTQHKTNPIKSEQFSVGLASKASTGDTAGVHRQEKTAVGAQPYHLKLHQLLALLQPAAAVAQRTKILLFYATQLYT